MKYNTFLKCNVLEIKYETFVWIELLKALQFDVTQVLDAFVQISYRKISGKMSEKMFSAEK